jgi:hypothetical protein
VLKCNVGWLERTVRLLIGLPTAVSYLYVRHFSITWAYALGLLGIFFLLTAFAAWCPLHQTLGTSTAKPLPD